MVCDTAELKTTVPVPTAQLGDVLAFDHNPPKVHVPLPIRKYAVGLEMDVSPAIVRTDAAPEPSRKAEPPSVIVPIAVSPAAADAPIVIVPAPTTMLPLTAKSNVPIARIPAQPVVSREAVAAFWSTVARPPPEFASRKTGSAEVGTEQPLTPPDESAQWTGFDQLPAPPTQYRLPPQREATITSTKGSDPSIVKTT